MEDTEKAPIEIDYRKKLQVYHQFIVSSNIVNLSLINIEDYSSMLYDLKDTLDLILKDSLSKDQKHFLINEYFPHLIKLLLNQPPCTSLEILRKINAFLNYWMYLRVRLSGLKFPGDAKILPKIFKAPKYYENVRLNQFDIKDLYEDNKKLDLKTINSNVYANLMAINKSKVLGINVNTFGQLEGFGNIHNGIANSEALAAYLPIIRRWMKTILNMSNYLEHFVIAKDICQIIEVLVDYLKRMTDEEMRLIEYRELKKILAYIKKLLKEAHVISYIGAQITEITQELGFRFFCLNSPKQKLIGIKMICGELNQMQNIWPSDTHDKEFRARNYVKWLNERKFYSVLCDSVNAEIITKAKILLEVSYAWEMLKMEKILQLWNCALQTKDMNLRKSIFNIVEGIALHFNTKDASIMKEEIDKLPLKDYDSDIIKLIASLARNYFFKSKKAKMSSSKKKVFVLEDFDPTSTPEPDSWLESVWELVQEKALSKGLSLANQEIAINTFIELTVKHYQEDILKFLPRCEENIVNNNSFAINSKIFMQLVSDMSKDLIYQSSLGIMKLFVSVLMFTISMKMSVAGKEGANLDDYYSQLNQRFSFMSFLIVRFEESLKEAIVKLILEAFLLNPFSVKEAEYVFKFFQEVLNAKKSEAMVQAGVFDFFFFDILLKHSPQEYSELELFCFLQILTIMNSLNKTIRVLQRPGKLELLHPKIIGIDCLWSIAFSCDNKQVQVKSREFLKNLYSTFSEQITPEIARQLLKDFIVRCMSYITDAKSRLKKEPKLATMEILAALDLLSCCLRQPNPESIASMTFDLIFQSNKEELVNVPVTQETKVIEALQTGILYLGFQESSFGSLTFMSEGKEILPTNETLMQSGIINSIVIEVKQGFVPANNTLIIPDAMKPAISQLALMFQKEKEEVLKVVLEKVHMDISEAVMILSNESEMQIIRGKFPPKVNEPKWKEIKKMNMPCFRTVFDEDSMYFMGIYEALNTDVDIINERIISLLSLVPVNKRLKQIIASVSSIDELRTLLMSTSKYKTAYILDIIESSLSEKNDMIYSFLRNNGISLLIELLVNLIPSDESKGTSAKLIQIVLLLIRRLAELGLKYTSKGTYEMYARLHSKTPEKVVFEEGIQILIMREIASLKLFEKLCVLSLESKIEFIILQTLSSIHLIPLLDTKLLDGTIGSELYKSLLSLIMTEKYNDDLKSSTIKEINAMIKLFETAGVDMPLHKVFYLEFFIDTLITKEACKECFTIVGNLIDLYKDPRVIGKFKHTPIEIVKFLLNLIFDSWNNKSDSNKNVNDYLNTIWMLVKGNSKPILELLDSKQKTILFDRCCNEIFGFSAKVSKPRMNSSPKVICNLLTILIANDAEMQSQILMLIVKFHQLQYNNPGKDDTKFNSKDKPEGYVGLKNLGCTCYLNSLFQQLFMMPHFRSKLLRLSDEEIKDAMTDESVLFNLRRIFEILAMKSSDSFSPEKFCKDFKFIEGNSIDVHQQQDADEFFNYLAEKIELELTRLNEDQILQEELAIEVICEITSLESKYPYKSNTVETYLSLPFMIKKCKSLEEGLNKFTGGDVLDDDNKYYCEEYKLPLKANKRGYIKKLSRTVVITLKRFEFDRNTSHRRKLNDCCEFPRDIDFYPWTWEGQQKNPKQNANDFVYTLVGVLVHSGSAEFGHYISFIKERSQNSPNYERWFEFNDERVSAFDFNHLRYYAFGETQNNSLSNTNAYILFYEKKSEAETSELVSLPDSPVFVDNHFDSKFVNHLINA